MSRSAIDERLARHADVIECARYEMTTLFQQLGDAESAVRHLQNAFEKSPEGSLPERALALARAGLGKCPVPRGPGPWPGIGTERGLHPAGGSHWSKRPRVRTRV